MDSINVLLIGVIVTIGVLLPPSAPYKKIVALLVGGDWFGVFAISIPTLLLLDSIRNHVERLLESPIFGILLIATGIVGAILTFRGGDSSALIGKMLGPLRTPTLKTAALGMILGVVQSLTSGPFFAGLAYLSATGISVFARYTGLLLYATLALSLPALSAVLVGFVRKHPASPAGNAFQWARDHQAVVSSWAGYFVAVVLVLMGIAHL